MAIFDLIYQDSASEGRFVTAVVQDGDSVFRTGPHPAKEAGPLIVYFLLGVASFRFVDRRMAEDFYIVRHFANMAAGKNQTGMAYPTKTP